MAAEAKIDSAALLRMLGEGLSQAAIARHFNVSRQAVNRRLKAMRRQANPDASVPAANEDAPADKVFCEFCEMESPRGDFDEEGMCRYCQWAYGKT
jgi:transposase